jgi:DNA gyrase subunit B
VAQPPLYGLKQGRKVRYIKDEKEFLKEILRRATEDLVVEAGGTPETQVRLEGAELRAFLNALDEYQQMFRRLERRLREARVVEALSNPALKLDARADFSVKENLEGVAEALRALPLACELRQDEVHSSWAVVYRDSTQAERQIGIELAALPEYRRLRALARQTARYNQPPFVVLRDSQRETQAHWRDLLAYAKAAGAREISVQRYKGLGEMNAEQLWETTMDPERRTLLEVRLEDAVEADLIFTTLMGEDVENRRKFIEDNALDVRNLDV